MQYRIMEDDLFQLRASSTEEGFIRRRSEFERRWFDYGGAVGEISGVLQSQSDTVPRAVQMLDDDDDVGLQSQQQAVVQSQTEVHGTNEEHTQQNDHNGELPGGGGGGDGRPRWFKQLYHTEPHMIVSCYNRRTCGMRFSFQGSSFSEAFNSVYKRVVVNGHIEMSLVPREMRRAQDKTKTTQGVQDGRINSSFVQRMVASTLFSTDAEAHQFCTTYTTFAINKFYDLIVCKARRWTIVRHSVRTMDSESEREQVTTVTFTLLFEYPQGTDTERTRAISLINKFNPVTSVSTMSYKCDCILSATSGLPCVHVTAVVLTYRSYSAAFPDVRTALHVRLLRIDIFFGAYWKRDTTQYLQSDEFNHWVRTPPDPSSAEGIGEGGEGEEEWETVAREERVRLTSYSQAKNLHGQAFRLAESFGPAVVARWSNFMQDRICHFRAARFPLFTSFEPISNTNNRTGADGEVTTVSNPAVRPRPGRPRLNRTRSAMEPPGQRRGRRGRGSRGGSPSHGGRHQQSPSTSTHQ